MELYILGPAFGLPSIDAECIASVALLRMGMETGWNIIPTHDQNRPLPYLKDGDEYIEGYRNINRHISELSGSNISNLDAKQRADGTALSSFLLSHAQTLLDISLYVSYENYCATRSAFTKILPWYANYIIPPAWRNSARTRTEHLGISSIDVDDVHEDLSNKPPGFGDAEREKSFEPETQKRASLLLPQRSTVSGLLRRPEHSAVFKLHALADNVFGPLQDMLGKSDYFLGNPEMSEVDCLAYGYMSLMLYPEMPQNWLRSTLTKKYARLVSFVERMHKELHMRTSVEDVMTLVECNDEQEVVSKRKDFDMTLPWGQPAATGVVDAASVISTDLISRIPLLGSTTALVTYPPTNRGFVQRHFPVFLATTATTLGLVGYYVFATGLLTWPHGDELQIFGRKRLADYGHLGAALAGMSLLGRPAAQNDGLFQQSNDNIPIGVEVELENDGAP
jgi:sorting and assembly machinery component 37